MLHRGTADGLAPVLPTGANDASRRRAPSGVKERVSAEMPCFPAEIPAVRSLTRLISTQTLIPSRGSTP
jgi:hypothetical protein